MKTLLAPLAIMTLTAASPPYDGPASISTGANGAMMQAQSLSVDLVHGTATVTGMCGWPLRCDPNAPRTSPLPAADMAELRALAIRVRATGITDDACVAARVKRHAGERGGPMLPPPPDPVWSRWEVAGVGKVECGPDPMSCSVPEVCLSPAMTALSRAADRTTRKLAAAAPPASPPPRR